MESATAERIKELEMALTAATNIIRHHARFNDDKCRQVIAANSCRLAELEQELAKKNEDLRKKEESLRTVVAEASQVKALAPFRSNRVSSSRLSVIIPVLNGGESLKNLLKQIRSQKKVNKVEIVIIDSGSTDGSQEVARNYGAKLVEIPHASFTHGSVRQMGIRYASGDYLFYTVQDIVPTSDHWLSEVVGIMDENPLLAVLSLRQMVTKKADLYSKWTNSRAYLDMGMTKDTECWFQIPWMFTHFSALNQRRLSFIDDVCACYRKKVLEKYGFADVPIAEDIELGVRMIKGGEHLGFSYSLGVYHWHSNPPAYFLKRCYSSLKYFVEFFGWPVQDFDSLHIGSLKDIGYRAYVLCNILGMVLDKWKCRGNISADSLNEFISLFRVTLHNVENENSFQASSALENSGLKAILNDVPGGNGKGMVWDSSVYIRNNHFLSKFPAKIKDFIDYYIYNKFSVDKAEFSDALLKIAAFDIGMTLSFWYMHLKTKGKHKTLDNLDRVMAKGVCH
jgi:rhamnosyltransferase